MLVAILAVLAVALVVVVFLLIKKNKDQKEALAEKQVYKAQPAVDNVVKAESAPGNDEEVAAFLALHLYLTQNVHDLESNVITIERIQKRYSPWSSKIYSINNFQR
ncbi:MAG TPA: hypothetical protein PKH58_02640 [Paludibacteraceae bacterium]|nr:hypothetical protein [Paludibacteraceae bacterium]HPT42922.1 hypothetical protein [Paludibacteraceae bacterium]